MRKTALLAFVLMAGLAPAQLAKVGQAPSKGIAARSSDVDAKVLALTKEIAWHASLDDAMRDAKKSGKPIFWIHMLGNLSGST